MGTGVCGKETPGLGLEDELQNLALLLQVIHWLFWKLPTSSVKWIHSLLRLFSFKKWKCTPAFSVMEFDYRNSHGVKGDRNLQIKKKKKKIPRAEFHGAWSWEMVQGPSHPVGSQPQQSLVWLFGVCFLCSCCRELAPLSSLFCKSPPHCDTFKCLCYPFTHQLPSLMAPSDPCSFPMFPALSMLFFFFRICLFY